MWASAPTGYERGGRCRAVPLGADLCVRPFAGFPAITTVGADALVGPRHPSVTARAAPAERERKGIRDFPGLEDSPGASRFIGTSTRNGQPSSAGGRRYALARTDPPQRFFLLDRARPVLFLSRTKREWGAHCRQQPGIPRPIGRSNYYTPPASARQYKEYSDTAGSSPAHTPPRTRPAPRTPPGRR